MIGFVNERRASANNLLGLFAFHAVDVGYEYNTKCRKKKGKTMRDYSIFDQLSDKEFEGVKAAVEKFIESEEVGMFGFISSKDMTNVATDMMSAMVKRFAYRGLMACNAHKKEESN